MRTMVAPFWLRRNLGFVHGFGFRQPPSREKLIEIDHL
jgi:hypothetical protein